MCRKFTPDELNTMDHEAKNDVICHNAGATVAGIGTLCRYKDVQIIDGAVCGDHIHLIVALLNITWR